VAPWARRLLPRGGGAELDSARGLRAAVAVPQHGGRRNPRSRVGTVTGLDELMRMLFARAGSRPGLWAAAFSPNAPAGACPQCKGLGFIQACDPGGLVSHPELPLGAGAMAGTRFGAYLGEPDGQFIATLRAVGEALGLDFSRPWRELGGPEREAAMAGCGARVFQVDWHYQRGQARGVHQLSTPWAGFAALVDREYERTHADPKGEALERLLGERPCPACAGERLNPESRAVTFAGLRFPELARMPVAEALGWFRTGPGGPVADTLRPLLLRRLEALDRAGLGYLSADREMATLSGGEAQRVRLAAALDEGLSGVAYVLDEPTRGLHPRDTARLAGTLLRLAGAGNAVVVVEHDPGIIARAGLVLELGPGAGPDGGRLMASGTPARLLAEGASHTGQLLRRRALPLAPPGGPYRPGVTVRGACLHNLRGFDLTFPAGALVAVTGVSGSGKSSLVQGVLARSIQAREAVGCAGLEWHQPVPGLLAQAQQDARGGQSTVATLAGVAEPLRKRFAASPEARALKLTARHFSSAGPGGRCEACQGRGVVTVALDLLPDVTVGCEECQGRRFQPKVLECRVAGLAIDQVLAATVADLARSFAQDPAIAKPLRALADIGLGYLALGQDHAALSAGERQRLRLAGLLAGAGARPAAVLLDEPTRGLGFGEVDRLLAALRRLARAGHLVVAVEHDLDFIAGSDWVIDLGPEGGAGGGTVVVQGPPSVVAACAESHTGRALGGFLT